MRKESLDIAPEKMIYNRRVNALVSICLSLASIICAAIDPRVEVALTADTPINGVSTTPDGRIFVLFARVDGSTGPQVAEYISSNNTYVPYPNAEWNTFNISTDDPASHLVRTNSQRIGPDGALWLVDTGSPGFGQPVILPSGPKLVQVNVTTNTVQRTINLANVTLPASLIDDVRFHPSSGRAFITDAGEPAIIVLDLATGYGQRSLENDPSTKGAPFPVSAEGKFLQNSVGGPQYIYADQHEVSPDGEWYYYQPCNGGMSRLALSYLEGALYNSSLASVLPQYVEPFALTPSAGGTAIDAEGNIYCSDTDRQAVVKIAPNGTWSTLVQDERLLWVDAMWIDNSSKKLWMPAAQLNRGEPFNNGSNFINKPLAVYAIDIGTGAPEIDHA